MDRRSLFQSAAADGLLGLAGRAALGADTTRHDVLLGTGREGRCCRCRV